MLVGAVATHIVEDTENGQDVFAKIEATTTSADIADVVNEFVRSVFELVLPKKKKKIQKY